MDVAAIDALLETDVLGRSLRWRASTGSTMDDAHEAAARGAVHGHTIVAGRQTAGRGARGRVWHSPEGAHLYMSIVLRDVAIETLTLCAGLGVADAVRTLDERPVWVKWPNDVWLGESPAKVAGLLAEARSAGSPDAVVLGIGLNLREGAWPTEVDAAALRDVSIARATAAVLLGVEGRLGRLSIEDLRDALLWRGERVAVDDVEGTLLDIDADGCLLLETDVGVRRVRAGTLRKP